MKHESEPITPDELVVRLIWATHYDGKLDLPVQPRAFEPKRHEADGISVFRASGLSSPEDALAVMGTEKRDKYAVALVSVEDLMRLGLSLRPAPIENLPGHAVVPELNSSKKADRVLLKELAILASARIIRKPIA